jgi:hypothetical protein
MAISVATAFRRAVSNIAAWGDTDVFPLPPENHVFFDRTDEVVKLLRKLHSAYGTSRDKQPPVNESALAMVGYTAFRWVTQLDPLWNAYLLGLVLALADDIERARLPRDQKIVFSYRFAYDAADHRLFIDSAWRDFNQRSLDLAAVSSHVLVCDIADFYARVYHHRIENSLLFLRAGPDLPKRIAGVLSLFSGGTSYGLPVGGPAARILSELLLNRVDRLLQSRGIVFCRFADDYHIFTQSREEAYDALRFLTEKLLQHEGLTLQRAKTRILTAKDFKASSIFAALEADTHQPIAQAPTSQGANVLDQKEGNQDAAHTADDTEAAAENAERSFLSLSLRYDPYSPTAKEDYAALKEQIEKFDIIGMLARELSKSRIHAALTRRLLQAIRYLDPESRDGAVRSLIHNIETLIPVFTNVMRVLTDVFDELAASTRAYIGVRVRQMITEARYYAVVPVNLGYAIRLLGKEVSEANQILLAQVYPQAPHFVQRDIVVIMQNWRATYWLSDQRLQFSRLHPWVQRSLLIASYVLEDEGDHWRDRIAGQLSPFDELVNKWAHERAKTGAWEVPL